MMTASIAAFGLIPLRQRPRLRNSAAASGSDRRSIHLHPSALIVLPTLYLGFG